MIHIENVLVYDIPPIVAAVGAIYAAKLGKGNQQKIETVHEAAEVAAEKADVAAQTVRDVKDVVEDVQGIVKNGNGGHA